jgi:hypothetical protein
MIYKTLCIAVLVVYLQMGLIVPYGMQDSMSIQHWGFVPEGPKRDIFPYAYHLRTSSSSRRTTATSWHLENGTLFPIHTIYLVVSYC